MAPTTRGRVSAPSRPSIPRTSVLLNPTRPYPTSAPPSDDEAEIEDRIKAAGVGKAAEPVSTSVSIPDADPDAPPDDPSSAESEPEQSGYHRIRRYGRHDQDRAPILPSPGKIAIKTIESRIADDLEYRAHQTSFMSSRRAGAIGAKTGPKSLESLAVGKVVESLRYDPKNGLETMRRCPALLQEMVLDRLHYVSFRGLKTLLPAGEEDLIAKEAAMDLEVWIIKNELMMRQEPASMEGLLTLGDDLDIVFPGSIVKGGYREIRRRVPPKSNFCFFDQMKPASIRIHNTTEGYAKTFRESTSGVLEGLDWNNVLAAGGIALNTLLRINEEPSVAPSGAPIVAPVHEQTGEKSDVPQTSQGAESSEAQPGNYKDWVSADRDSDIDIYIYGITDPRKANDKIRHIYSVWSKNVDAAATAAGKKEEDMPKKLVIRNSKTVNFLSDYPHRRIQIILKIVASPTEVLLNFDLDPCAIGFNGNEVLMLPRCARALETGYSVFTTDLVEGHHLGDRRETQLPRVFKYADRGFGIRILPQYLRTLKAKYWRDWANDSYIYRRWGEEKPKFIEPPIQHRDPVIMEKNRLLRGRKLITRVAYYEEDFIHRLWVGPTHRSRYSEDDDITDSDDQDYNESSDVPYDVNLGHLDGRREYAGASAPHGKNGIGGFQLLYRHAAVWLKDKEGLLKIERDSFIAPSYEPDGYSELPKYEWGPTFKVGDYARSITDYNSMIYGKLESAIQADIPWHVRVNGAAFEGYFTRRTERLCAGYDLDEQLERELAIPVYIPADFESYANKVVKEVLKEKGIVEPSGADFNLLIPVHEPGMGPGLIRETPREDYNWSFWIIGPSVAWARLDRKIDEIFEVLWNFFNIRVADDYSRIFLPDCQDEWSHLLKMHLDRRSPRIAPKRGATSTEETKTFVWPDERERRLFKKWMTDFPTGFDRDMVGYQGDMGHDKFQEEDNVVPDEREYWRENYEVGNLEDWLNWGEYMDVVGRPQVRPEWKKRKRVSVGGPPAKKLEEDEDYIDE